MDEFIHWPKPLPSLVSNLWWNIVMDDWHLQIYNAPPPKKIKWNNVGLAFSVGDTMPQFTINIEHND